MTISLANAINLLNSGQRDQARQICEQLRQQTPNQPEVIHLAGVIAAQDRQHESAIELFQQALQLHSLAGSPLQLGRRITRDRPIPGQAAEQLQTALNEDDRYGRAYFFLSQIASYHDRQLLEQIQRVLRTPPLPQEEQCLLHFAAGKISDDLGSYDEAIYHYDLGNAARQANFDVAQHLHWIDRMIQATSDVAIGQVPAAETAGRRPIFVIGMPRSGTSLVEQILASHPDVAGAGELPDIPSISHALEQHCHPPQPYPECLASLSPRVFAGFAEAYRQRLDQVATAEASHVVDKNPGNFLHVALLAAMFPQAAIIHCSRHPLSTCLSCYFQNFASQHDYAFHRTHLGFYYAQYVRLMKHWQEILPQRVLEFRYERLVAEPEPAVRELLDWCGLSWDERCLAPHKTTRPVNTASAWEVRQPIYRSSVERWRNYLPHLASLRNALEQGGVVCPV